MCNPAELAGRFLTSGLTSHLPGGTHVFRHVQLHPLTLIAFRDVSNEYLQLADAVERRVAPHGELSRFTRASVLLVVTCWLLLRFSRRRPTRLLQEEAVSTLRAGVADQLARQPAHMVVQKLLSLQAICRAACRTSMRANHS